MRETKRPFTKTEEQKVSLIRYRVYVYAEYLGHLEETEESF